MTKERNERYKRICQRVREMWESEGRPLGSHDVFWLRAMAEVDAASPDDATPSKEIAPMSRAVVAMDDLATKAPKPVPPKAVKMHSSRL